MSEEEMDPIEMKLLYEISKMLSKTLKLPVYVINPKDVQLLLTEVKKIPGIDQKYSAQELHDEVSSFLSRFIVMRPKDEAGARKIIQDFVESLIKIKNFEAMLIMPNVIGVPIGTRIGCLEIIEQEIDDQDFNEFLSYYKEHKQIHLKDRSKAKVTFSAYTTFDATKVLYKILELPFAILSLILDINLDARDCIGFVKSSDVSIKYFLEPQRECREISKFNAKYFSEHLERLSKISIEKNPTPLQRKILQALEVYGLSRGSQKVEIKFICLISSFESLLLSMNDRDYLGMKLSEKTAFLLEEEYEKRLKLFDQMKSYYSKRSMLVHSGKKQITDIDGRNLDSIFRTLVFKLLELSMTYSKMEQRERESQQEGIEDLINRKKFS